MPALSKLKSVSGVKCDEIVEVSFGFSSSLASWQLDPPDLFLLHVFLSL